MSRKKATFLNLVVSVMRIGVSSLLALVVSQQILVRYGSSVNGVVATATQIVLLLQVLEGGFTTATLVALYRPFVERDYFEMNAVLSSTARSFRKIAGIALAVGIGLAVIYPLFLKTEMPYGQRVVVFGLVVLTSVLNFAFFQSRQIMFAVAQKEYIPQTTAMICTTISQLLMLLLLCFDLSILWLRAGVFFLLLLNGIWVCLLARKIFPYWKIDLSLPRREIKGTGDVVFYNIVAVLYRGTPMYMIATMFGAVMASVYSVYYMFFSLINTTLFAITAAPKNAFGQLLHNKEFSREKFITYYDIYETMIITLAVSVYVTCAVFVLPVISLYTAKLEDRSIYLNSFYVIFFCLLNFTQNIHIPAGLLLQIDGKFKVIKRFQTVMLLAMLLCGGIGAAVSGVVGMMFGLVFANCILATCEIVYSYQKVLCLSLWKFVYKVLILLLVGGVLICFELILRPPLQSWLTLFVWGSCTGGLNLAASMTVAFLVMPADTKKIFIKAVRDFLYKKFI